MPKEAIMVHHRISDQIIHAERQLTDYHQRLKACAPEYAPEIQERILYFDGRLSGLRQALALVLEGGS